MVLLRVQDIEYPSMFIDVIPGLLWLADGDFHLAEAFPLMYQETT